MLKGMDIRDANDSENLSAYIFGSISPNKSNMKVIITTCTMNPRTGAFEESIREVVIKLAKITIATFMKLLEISMLARRGSGFFKCSNANLLLLFPFSSRDSTSDGESEKKATSDPEISAEQANRIITTNNSITIAVVSGWNTSCNRGIN